MPLACGAARRAAVRIEWPLRDPVERHSGAIYARRMRVLVAMSGGVDSSVAAALLVEQGHEVVGVTLKLWSGPNESGCCAVGDVEDARRVAAELGIAHYVLDETEPFWRAVVQPNPCIECNRYVKFGLLAQRAMRLGFDALATGHHARVAFEGGRFRLLRGRDLAKDQSYVLAMLGQRELARLLLPVGELTKAEVRELASARGLRTATKPDSQEVCFVGRRSRREFLAEHIGLTPGVLVERSTGQVVGQVDAVELVTAGQRRRLGLRGAPSPFYAVEVDPQRARVVVARREEAQIDWVALVHCSWVDEPLDTGARVLAQSSAHGPALPAVVLRSDEQRPAALAALNQPDEHRPGVPAGLARPGARGVSERTTWIVRFDVARPPIAPGQTVALYCPDEPDAVVGCGIVVGSGRGAEAA
jgi:tRNA-specific 2-thiouridylase